jgi:hypothetical protein
MKPAAELLLNIRCVALFYVHIAIQQAAAMLIRPDGFRVIIC